MAGGEQEGGGLEAPAGGGPASEPAQGASGGAPEDPRVDLVFEGGGVKGIGLAGAFGELWERGYRPQCAAGTSAGAITAALVAAGYSGPQIQEIVLREMKFERFEDPSFWDHFGVAGDMVEFLKARGMHSGDYFLDWMREKLKEAGKVKFGDLRDEQATNERRRYTLQVIASDLSARSMLVLPRDAAQLGIDDPDELEIAEAVRMSMSIPVFFKPVLRKDGQGRTHTIVDGGLLSNYPIWLFDSPPGSRPRFPTFGMLLVAPNQADPLLPAPAADAPLPSVAPPVDFAKAIVETMMEAHDRLYVEAANFARTIAIPTLGVRTTQFDIDEETATKLFDSGRQAAEEFLSGWSFRAYLEEFRDGTNGS
ncbi:MAG TPA: patatin-like phospholipase family protein [Solirubrobacteraceae bacterium]|jgi:NTE family protein|nr:patatin-like phospholipase family protein [Solirubrobacteraceae bacterium]